MTFKLLLAMKDSTLCPPLEAALGKSGFEVLLATTSAEALQLINLERPAYIILDSMLQETGGLRLCKIIRASPEMLGTRIIMIGETGDMAERIRALDAGADDYLARPVVIEELLARIATLQGHQSKTQASRILQAGTIKMVPEEWAVYVEGNPVDLTEKEYRLLHELMQVKGRVLTRESLLERVWGHQKGFNLETRTVDVHMSRLRNKLGRSANNIVTVRNIGYRINLAPEWLEQ